MSGAPAPTPASVPSTGGASGAGVVVGLAGPDEFEAVDRLIDAAYRHDYGPSEHEDPRGSPPSAPSASTSGSRAKGRNCWAA
ncbi:hypothetical protein [Leucobacter soli]|uniref:hypothetical protein n=1 Tax=Leucobacter soli TaxID=2812850 RepID=UPI00361A0FAC